MADSSSGKLRIDHPGFQHAVDLIDAGAIDELRRHLEQNPALLSVRAELTGDDPGPYFASPYLLWFTAENPARRSAPHSVTASSTP